VDARQEIDLRIGAAFTRFQTLRLKEKFSGLPENPISYGPCQFPTLGFVVQRYLRIKNFIPEDFWSIQCMHEKVRVNSKSLTNCRIMLVQSLLGKEAVYLID
jgi:DNA topoisomerase-3